MNESFNLIKFKYEHGAYDISQLMDLIPYFISKEEFFEITRSDYDILLETKFDFSKEK